MSDKPDPKWMRLIPNERGWATIGIFALVFYMLFLIDRNSELRDSDLFKTVATLLMGSGAFGLVCAFLWGGSKASVAASDTVNAVARGAAPAAAAAVAAAQASSGVQPVQVVNTASDRIPVEGEGE